MSEKTEEATPKRLRKAREEGDSGASTQAAQALAFLVAVVLAGPALRACGDRVVLRLREAFEVVARGRVPLEAAGLASGVARDVLTLTAPLLAATALGGAIATAAQTGGFLAFGRLAPKLERLDLVEGLKGLVRVDRLFSVARALLAAGFVVYFVVGLLKAHAADVARTAGELRTAVALGSTLAYALAWDAARLGLCLGALDLLVVRFTYRRRLRMSREEIKREYRESEGDPQIKQARERAHHEMLAATTVANVRTAKVVVVNPTHVACALRYDVSEGDEAPVIVASGEGDLAQQIRRAAEEYGVPIVRDVPLARALLELEVGEAIPEALYEAVAEILHEIQEPEGQRAGET